MVGSCLEVAENGIPDCTRLAYPGCAVGIQLCSAQSHNFDSRLIYPCRAAGGGVRRPLHLGFD